MQDTEDLCLGRHPLCSSSLMFGRGKIWSLAAADLLCMPAQAATQKYEADTSEGAVRSLCPAAGRPEASLCWLLLLVIISWLQVEHHLSHADG